MQTKKGTEANIIRPTPTHTYLLPSSPPSFAPDSNPPPLSTQTAVPSACWRAGERGEWLDICLHVCERVGGGVTEGIGGWAGETDTLTHRSREPGGGDAGRGARPISPEGAEHVDGAQRRLPGRDLRRRAAGAAPGFTTTLYMRVKCVCVCLCVSHVSMSMFVC